MFNFFAASRFTPEAQGEAMSFDLGVWHPEKRIGNKKAGELYVRLCDGDTSGGAPNPAVEEFYAELTAKHPEIDTIPRDKIDDHDDCPWSCKRDHSPAYLIMSCVWSKATDVGRLVEHLARKHGLATYDPQSDVVTYADGSTGTKATGGALWVLSFYLLIFVAIFIYVGNVAPSGRASPAAFYAAAGFCRLAALACVGQALRQRHSLNASRDQRESR
jgi:hypothetical protein